MDTKIGLFGRVRALIFLVSLILLIGISVVFGLLNYSILRSFELEVRATEVVFRFGGNTYLDQIASENVQLNKGAKTDIMMQVSAVGSRRIVVEYSINFVLEKNGSNADLLLSAVEVYTTNQGRSIYLGTLADIEDVTLSGIMVTDFAKEIPLELVFSATVSDIYCAQIGIDSDFSIRASASAIISSQSEKYVFASDSEEFIEHFQSPQTVGKTIILALSNEQSYIELPTNVRSKGIVGIDLNGYELKLGANTLTIDCQQYSSLRGAGFTGFVHSSMEDAASKVTQASKLLPTQSSLMPAVNSQGKEIFFGEGFNFGRLGILDSAGGGAISGDGSLGIVQVENASDVFLIADTLMGNLATGRIRLSGDIEVVFDDFLDVLNLRAERLTDGTVFLEGDDVSFLFDGLRIYNQPSFFVMEPAVEPNSIVFDPDSNGFVIANTGELTSKYGFGFRFTLDRGATMVSKYFVGQVNVRGNGSKAIADWLNGMIDQKISASQFFRQYDSVTGAHIEWQVSDHMNGILLDDNGIYRKHGLDELLAKLTSFSDKEITIYIKISKGTEDGESYVEQTGETFAYRHQAVTVTAKERTALIFDNSAVVLAEGGIFDIRQGYLDSLYLGEVGLVGIKIDILSDSNGYAVLQSDGQFDMISISGNPVPKNTLYELELLIRFVYSVASAEADGTDVIEYREYTLPKTLTIEGEYAQVTKYDMSYTLQTAFSSNNYTKGIDNMFYAYGALRPMINGQSVPVFCDYTPEGEASDYLSVRYEFSKLEDGQIDAQFAYFVKEGEAYRYIDRPQEVDSSLLYQRRAVIEVMYARISTIQEIMAYFDVNLYTLSWQEGTYTDPSGNLILGSVDFGKKDIASGVVVPCQPSDEGAIMVYKDPTSGKLRELSYSVWLQIVGIIRNDPSQIADVVLYDVFLNIFDANKDGIISGREARDWEGVKNRMEQGENIPRLCRGYWISETVLGQDVEMYFDIYYIDLSGLKLSSLKGIEYFTEVEGYNLQATNRISIIALESLYNLRFLHLYSNYVSDLSPLANLNKLEYLNLYNNRVSRIDDIRYLPNLKYLNLGSSLSSGYNNISNYEPLVLSQSLEVLDLRGMRTSQGTGLHADGPTMYYFALLTINCAQIRFLYDFAIEISQEMLVAAHVMRDLESINRVSKTLYMPTYYYYQNSMGETVKYQLYWYVDKDENNLVLSYDEDNPVANPVVKYTIKSPILDKPVRLYLKVFVEIGSADSYGISREFRLTLESSLLSERAYIYDYSNGNYILAEEAVPDEGLRSKLFQLFNYYVGADGEGVPQVIIEGKTVSEGFVISKADLDYFYEYGTNVERDFSYLSIKSLKGISYFARALRNVKINLMGNLFDSSELAELVFAASQGPASITLGVAEYDFGYLLNESGGLIPASITMLYVFDCYGLEKEEILSSLYRVYLSKNTFNIYLENSYTIWNPFAKTLAKTVSSFWADLTFMRVGESYSLYELNGGNASGIPFDVFGVEYTMTLASARLFVHAQNQLLTSSSSTNNCNYLNGVLTYSRALSSQNVATLRLNPQFSIRRGTTNTNIVFNSYYIQIAFDDAGDYIDVFEDGNPDGYLGTLSEVVSLDELKISAYTLIHKYIAQNWNSALKSHALASLATSGGSFCIESDYDGAYVGYRGRIAISTQMLGDSFAMSGQDDSLKASISYNKSKYKEQGSLAGLQYFTGIKKLDLSLDIDLGNGVGLKNITELKMSRMVVDFSTITMTAQNLTRIEINYYYSFDAGFGGDSAFRYFPALEEFVINSSSVHANLGNGSTSYRYWINDFSFLEGLIDPITQTSKLRILKIYGRNGQLSSVSTMPTSIENANSVKALYVAARKNGCSPSAMFYQIGSPTLQSDLGYFFALATGDDYQSDNWNSYYVASKIPNADSLTIADLSGIEHLSWGVAENNFLQKEGSFDFSYLVPAYLSANTSPRIKDMALRYNQSPAAPSVDDISNSEYWLDNERRDDIISWLDNDGAQQTSKEFVSSINTGTAIYLPASTAPTYYGLVFGEGENSVITRDYRINWEIFVVFVPNGAGSVGSRAQEHTLTYNGRTNAIGFAGGSTAILESTYAVHSFSGHEYDNYLKLSLDGIYANSYVSIIGTFIVEGVVSEAYSFWYEFKVGSGDGIYTYNQDTDTGVRDLGLRMWLFANRKKYIGTTLSSMNIATQSNKILRRFLYSTMGYKPFALEAGGSSVIDDIALSVGGHIKSLYGISDVLEHWGAKERITNLTLKYGKLDDISPLYPLEELANLDFSGEQYFSDSAGHSNVAIKPSITQYNGGAGAFLKLKSLNLNYCLSITPDSIKLLSLTQRPDFAQLSIYNTRCSYNYETVEYLKVIIESTSKKEISLSFGYNVAETITIAMINDFMTQASVEAVCPNGRLTMDSPLYQNNSMSTTKKLANSSGFLIDVGMSFYISSSVANLIKNYLVAPSLNIRTMISISTQFYRQFSGLYLPDGSLTFYNPSVTSPLQFGIYGRTAEFFDTEVLAALFTSSSYKDNFVKNANGYYVYIGSTSIVFNATSIKELKKTVGGVLCDASVELRGSSATISLRTEYASKDNALSYKESFIAQISTANLYTPNYSFSEPNINSTLLNYISNRITYITGNQPEFGAQLPNRMFFKGVLNSIEWGFGTSPTYSGAYSTYNNVSLLDKGILDVAGNPIENAALTVPYRFYYKDTTTSNIYLILNSITLPEVEVVKVAGMEFEDYFSLRSTVRNNHPYLTIIVNRKAANITTLMNKYIEARTDGDIFWIDKEDGSPFVLCYSDGTPYSAASIPYQTLFKKESGASTYYSFHPGGEDISTDTVIFKASYIFDSPYLSDYLFTSIFTTQINKSDGFSYGNVLTMEALCATTQLDFKYNNGAESYANYARNISSIEGVQIFYNLNSFIARTGMFYDISPLATLTLKTFYYSPISDINNVTVAPNVFDFAPLLAGSKHTLEYFSYNGNGMVQMLDLSFLLGFSSLKKVFVASSYYSIYPLKESSGSSYEGGYNYMTFALSYFMTQQGKYLINALAAKNVYIYTVAETESNSAMKAIQNSVQDSSLVGGYRTVLTLDYDNYVDKNDPNNIARYNTLYALCSSIDERFAYQTLNSFGGAKTIIKDGYIMEIDSSDITTQKGRVSFDVASTLVSGGEFYVIDWKSSAASTIVNKRYLTSDLKIGSKIYTKNTALSASELQEIANSMEYYSQYRAGLIELRTSISVVLNQDLRIKEGARLTLNIRKNDRTYSRMLTLAFT